MAEKAAVATPVVKSTVKTGTLQRKCACGGTVGASGMCPACEAKARGLLQRKASAQGTPAVPAIVDSVLASPGRPLDPGTRSTMEKGFGTDLSGVRIHTDSRAAESARAVDAHAYTVGQNIAFGNGQYAPETSRGQRLLAHEIAHTVQQGGLQRSASASLDVSPAYSSAEVEADRAADAVVSGRAATGLGATGLKVARVSVANAEATNATVPEKAPDVWAGLDRAKLEEAGVTDILAPATAEGERVYVVKYLVVPASKGSAAMRLYEGMAKGRQLVATAEPDMPLGQTAFKQEFPSDEVLAKNWLGKARWSAGNATALWNRATGGKNAGAFAPRIGESACAYAPILEPQFGDAIANNVQLLDPGPFTGKVTRIQVDIGRRAKLIKEADKANPPKSVTMRFDAVEPWPADPVAGLSCLDAEARAMEIKDENPAAPLKAEAAAPKEAPKEGDKPEANPANTRLTFGDRNVDIYLDPEKTTKFEPEGAIRHLAPGFLLSAYMRGKKGDSVEGIVDLKGLFALVGAEKNAVVGEILKLTSGPKVSFTAEDAAPVAPKEGEKPALPEKKLKYGALGGTSVKFEYAAAQGKGELKLDYDEKAKALAGKGSFKSQMPFLKDIDFGLLLIGGSLSVSAKTTKDKAFRFIPGASIKDADLKIQLLPKLGGNGSFTAVIGSYATAAVKVSIGEKGVEAEALITPKIPRIDAAAGTVKYKEGAWSGNFNLEVTSAKLPGFKDAKLNIDFGGGRIKPSGTINLRIANTDVQLKASLQDKAWFFSAKVPALKIPGLEGPIAIDATYTDGHVMAEGRGAALKFGNWGGTLDVVHYQDGKLSGTGSVTVGKPGDKVAGTIKAALFPNGKWSADGTVSVTIREGLVATVGVHIDENQKVFVKGALEFPTIEVPHTFYQNGFQRELAKISFPIVGISVGPKAIGFTFDITGGIGAAFSIGPARLEGVRLAAQFNPFEQNTEYDLEGTGRVVVPMDVSFNGTIEGALALDAYVASGSFGVQAKLGIGAKAESKLESKIRYKGGNLSVDAAASIMARPYLTLDLDAIVRAKVVGYDPYEKKYPLKAWKYDTGLEVGVYAPFHYESVKGFRAPGLSDVKVTAPDINVRALMDKMLKRVGVS